MISDRKKLAFEAGRGIIKYEACCLPQRRNNNLEGRKTGLMWENCMAVIAE
jgi:hypothetical protein